MIHPNQLCALWESFQQEAALGLGGCLLQQPRSCSWSLLMKVPNLTKHLASTILVGNLCHHGMTWWICSLSLVMNTDIWIHCSCRVVLVLYRLTGMPSLWFFHVLGGMDRSCVIVQSYCVQQTCCPTLEWSKAMVVRLGTVCNSTWNPQIWVCLQWSCFSRRCPSC